MAAGGSASCRMIGSPEKRPPRCERRCRNDAKAKERAPGQAVAVAQLGADRAEQVRLPDLEARP